LLTFKRQREVDGMRGTTRVGGKKRGGRKGNCDFRVKGAEEKCRILFKSKIPCATNGRPQGRQLGRGGKDVGVWRSCRCKTAKRKGTKMPKEVRGGGKKDLPKRGGKKREDDCFVLLNPKVSRVRRYFWCGSKRTRKNFPLKCREKKNQIYVGKRGGKWGGTKVFV